MGNSSSTGCVSTKSKCDHECAKGCDDESPLPSPQGFLQHHCPHGCTHGGAIRSIGGNGSPNDKVAAVVVTICDGSTYDAMFKEVKQEGAAGTRVAVYEANYAGLKAIRRGLAGEAPQSDKEAESIRALLADIALVDNDCVVFNWECCGGCSESGFPHGFAQDTLELIGCVLERGSMAMCSDFSLKALIADWREDVLGPCPFVTIGGFDRQHKLEFDPAVLAKNPSSQLVRVGELCADKGQAIVSAMSGTIAYTVDPRKLEGNSAYRLEVLTVVSEMHGLDLDEVLEPAMRCQVNATYGSAGHTLLTYPTGGMLLTSAGHWLELVQLDVSVERIVEVARKEYGEDYSQRLNADLCDANDSAEVRYGKLQGYAKQLTLSSAPCAKRVSSKYSQ